MTGAEIALLVSGLMSGAGALFGGGGERQSFGAGTAHGLLDRATESADGVMGMMQGLLGQPINPTQAPGPGSLPTFSGGGMPMPIGVLGGAPSGAGSGGGGLPGLSMPKMPKAPGGGPGGDVETGADLKPQGARPVRLRGRTGPGGPMGHTGGAPANYRLPGENDLRSSRTYPGSALGIDELMAIVRMGGKG